MATVDGDMDLLHDLVATMVSEAPLLLQAVREALHARNAELLHRAAHSLKGAVGNFSAHEAWQTAHELEMQAKQGNLHNCEAVVQRLESAVHRLVAALCTSLDRNIEQTTADEQLTAR